MKVALITGASKGIGKEIAIKLANDGYAVVINYNGSYESAKKLEDELKKDKKECMIYKCNITNNDEVTKMVNDIIEKYKTIDVLVNNSGITKDNLVLRMTNQDFKDVIDTNLIGAFNVIKAVSRYMFKQNSGSIINISSVVGLYGNIGQANYSASKAGIIGLSKSLAKEFSLKNIRVNVVCPGFIKTDMTDKLSDDIKNNILERILLKRFGDAKDIANLVSFLASDNASYITNQVISCDGGIIL